MNDVKTPLFRLAKRDELGRGKVWAIRAGSIIVALILGCIPMLLTGNSPAEAYGVILQGSLSRPIYIKQTVKIAIPLLGCALAIAPCFKMRFWNIGAEGQMAIGILAFLWLLMWIKWTFPRLRIDQILTLEWKYLVPIGLANLLLMVIVVVFNLHF